MQPKSSHASNDIMGQIKEHVWEGFDKHSSVPNKNSISHGHICEFPSEVAHIHAELTSSMSARGKYTLVEVYYREDTRPGHPLEASRKQHEILCKRLKAKKVSFTPSFLVGDSIQTFRIYNHLKELALDTKIACKIALKLHAHSLLYAHKLVTTRRALRKSSCSQGLGLEQGAACHPPDPY